MKSLTKFTALSASLLISSALSSFGAENGWGSQEEDDSASSRAIPSLAPTSSSSTTNS